MARLERCGDLRRTDARQVVSHDGGRTANRRRPVPRRCARDLQRRPPGARAMGRPGPLADAQLRSPGPRGVGADRSRTRAAARHQFHQQLAHPRARRRSGGNQVVAALDDLAAGPADDLRLLRMSSSGPQALRPLSPWDAFVDGLMRVKRAPWCVIGLWLATVLVALPFAMMLQGMIGDHLGASLAAESAAEGVNYDWWNEFLAQTSGFGVSFVPAILGFAAVLKNLSTIADTTALPAVIAIAVSAHTIVSLFLIGGVLDRLARDRAIGAGAFFSACGVYAVRFFRLAIIATVGHWVLFGPYHDCLFAELYPVLMDGLTVVR